MSKDESEIEEETKYREVYEDLLDELGIEHPETLAAGREYSDLLFENRKFDFACPILVRTYKSYKRAEGVGSDNTQQTGSLLAFSLFCLEKYAESEVVFRELFEARKKKGQPNDEDLLVTEHMLGKCMLLQNKSAYALPFLQDAFRRQKIVFSLHDEETFQTGLDLCLCLDAQKKMHLAESVYREIYTARRSDYVSDPESFQDLCNLFGTNMMEQKKYAAAESLYREAYTLSIKTRTLDSTDTLGMGGNLALCLIKQGKFFEASEIQTVVYEGYRSLLGEENVVTIRARDRLQECS